MYFMVYVMCFSAILPHAFEIWNPARLLKNRLMQTFLFASHLLCASSSKLIFQDCRTLLWPQSTSTELQLLHHWLVKRDEHPSLLPRAWNLSISISSATSMALPIHALEIWKFMFNDLATLLDDIDAACAVHTKEYLWSSLKCNLSVNAHTTLEY